MSAMTRVHSHNCGTSFVVGNTFVSVLSAPVEIYFRFIAAVYSHTPLRTGRKTLN